MSLSNTSDRRWPSEKSLASFYSPSLPNMPGYYNRSMIAPLSLSQRKAPSHSMGSHLPPLKMRSKLTFCSSEDDDKTLTRPSIIVEEEDKMVIRKLDRVRVNHAQALEDQRHVMNKVQYRKNNVQQVLDERNDAIHQLLTTASHTNKKIHDCKNEIAHQRLERDQNEMKQLKLRRTLGQLQNTKEIPVTKVSSSARAKFIEQYDAHLSQLKAQCKEELAARDGDIKRLKGLFSDEVHGQSEEYLTLLRATERAYDLESQKRDLLKQCVDDYEVHVYRATKPCCLSTSYRLNKASTQLRLYSIIELALHELFHSSCSCGQFQRAYQTFLRLHDK